MKFLPSSLDTLVKNLRNKPGVRLEEKFEHTYKFFKEKYPNVEEKHFALLTRKGIFPYDFMDSFDRMDEDIPTDPKVYANDLTKEKLSKGDATFLAKLKEVFKLKTLRHLHDLYLETDVLLLSDVFEHFHRWSIVTYQLDPAHFLTAPSLSWMAALKFTGQKLDVIKDPDMSLFVDDAVIGGISLIANSYAKANNAKLKGGATNGKKSFIIIFDCNNQVIND